MHFCNCLVVWVVLLVTGCSLVPTSSPEWIDPRLSMVWPPDPEQPRIRFLKSISGSDDLSSNAKRSPIVGWLTGDASKEYPLLSPYGIAADGEGRFWVADIGIHGIHEFDLRLRSRSYVFGSADVLLNSPVGVAVDVSRSRLYVSDSVLREVFCFDFAGRLLTRIQPEGGYERPTGLAVDVEGRLYVVDTLGGGVLIFSPDGKLLQRIETASARDDRLYMPTNVAVDRNMNLAVVDSMNFRVVLYDRFGTFVTTIGKLGDAPGAFARPRGVAFDSDGHIYVVDAAFDNIQIFDSAGRLLLYFPKSGKAPGEFSLPSGIFIDRFDRIYVSDTYNRRIQLFQYLSVSGG